MNESRKMIVNMKVKNYGIDALKILSMLMVVVLHVLTNGGILNASVRFTGQYEAGWFLQTACFCAVDVFALITGYLWVNARYKYRNVIELWLQVFLYSVIISIGMKLLFPSSVSFFDVLKSFFPVMTGQYWYFSSYFALFLFIPLLNTVLEHIDKKQMLFSLIMILIFFSGFQTLFYSDVFGTMDGYSAIWLMILYLIGGYIGKYHAHSDRNPLLFFLGYVLMVVLTWLSKVAIELLTLQLLGEVRAGNYLISYKSPTILMSAVFLLLCFSNLKLSDWMKKLVSFVAPMSFSVYLIHNHPLVASVVMNRMFAPSAELPVAEMVMKVLGTALFIYAVCSVIDRFRLYVFKVLEIRERIDKIEGKLKLKVNTEASKNTRE